MRTARHLLTPLLHQPAGRSLPAENRRLPFLCAQIDARWLGLLQRIVSAYEHACTAEGGAASPGAPGPQLLGVYLRGSLPKGTAVAGLSDIDTFALCIDTALPQQAKQQQPGAQVSAPQSKAQARPLAAAEAGLKAEMARLLKEDAQAAAFFTKVEAKLLRVAPGSEAAAALLAAQRAQSAEGRLVEASVVLQQTAAATAAAPTSAEGAAAHANGTAHAATHAATHAAHPLPRRGGASTSGGKATPAAAALLPARVLPEVPAAFEVKSQAVCLSGLDLPALLPDVAALPQ